jgi:hypothetical protein
MKTSYRGYARRDGSWWDVQIRRERGLRTRVRDLGQAESSIRDVISLVFDVPCDSIDVVIEVIPDELDTERLVAS